MYELEDFFEPINEQSLILYSNFYLFQPISPRNPSMNFRKSLHSLHYSGSHSLKKIQLNPNDLQDCNYESAPSTKQSENSILNKLLLQPLSLKAQQSNKLSLQGSKKYQPKFAKPDVQNLIQQSINLKNVVQCHLQTINQLKIKIIDMEKKMKLLEKGLEKVEKEQLDNLKQLNGKQQSKLLNKVISSLGENKNVQGGGLVQNNVKTGTVHTQILKKKIADLTVQNISLQRELRFLKKLPNITVYEQNDTQKEHLMAETIRLKSIISSLSQQPQSEQSQKFQNQFMRLMKQQNQKLKATIRLLQNDKILLKSRQTIQTKLNSDLKKQIQHFKTKLLYKQSQLQKINNENKNLLFKKTTQFRQQQQKKQNQLLAQLRTKIVISENSKLKLQQNNEMYAEENMTLKQKEKNLTQQIAQIQTKYDKLVKKLNQEIEELQFELNNFKTDYINLLNSGNLKKKKSLALNKQPSNGSHPNMHKCLHPSPLASQKLHSSFLSRTYSRPVKWEGLFLAMAHLFITLEQNSFLTVESLVSNVQENQQVRCGDLINMFIEEPFNMTRKQANKLGRYICEDQSLAPNSKVLENQNLTIDSSLAKTILTSSLQKMTQKLSPEFLYAWSAILNKTLKLQGAIKEAIKDKSHISREQMCAVINKTSRQKVEYEEYDFMMLKCMEVDLSEDDFVLSSQKIHEFLQTVLNLQMDDNDQ